MAKFKALKTFRDIHTKVIYEQGTVIEMAVKRADEVKRTLTTLSWNALKKMTTKTNKKIRRAE